MRAICAVEGVLAGAGLLGLLVEGMEAEAKSDGEQSQNAHGDAQALDGRAEIGEGAGGEIEGYAHGLAGPRQCAGSAGDACVAECGCDSGFRARREIDDGEAGVVDPAGELGGCVAAGVVERARGRLELVFKIGGGDGDAALNFSEAQRGIFRQVEGAIEQQVAAVGDGGGERERAEVGGQHGFHGIDGFKRGEAGGKNRAGLVAGGADGGFVLGEDGAGKHGGEHLPLGLVLGEDLVADAGVLHVEGNHFAQAEAQDGKGFSGAGGQGIEVEHEDADGGVGKHQRDGAGARRDLVERGANGGGDGFRRRGCWVRRCRGSRRRAAEAAKA